MYLLSAIDKDIAKVHWIGVIVTLFVFRGLRFPARGSPAERRTRDTIIGMNNTTTQNTATNRSSLATSGGAVKARQLVTFIPRPVLTCSFSWKKILITHRQQTQLHAQLAQLSANLSDTENLLRMTSVQAECMRGLGSYHGAL